MPRIMIIHPEGNINNNPNLTGIVEILCEKGHTVDIYSPRVAHMQQCAPCSGANLILADAKPVSRPDFLAVFPFESVESPESISDYINCNVPDYDLIIGVDRGIIEAAIVARKQKVPYGLISYEILFSEETGLEYTLADRGAARGASFAVCQDRVRSFHLSREIGIPLERIIDIPVSGRAVKHGARNYILHEKLGFSKETKIALYIGGITYKWSGIDELIAGTDRWSDDWVLVLHHRYSTYDQAFIDKISCKQKQNVFLSPFPSIPFDQLHTLLNAADVGLSFYIPQFQRNGFTDRNNLKYIGMSSGKTSTYIQHGLPVIINEIGQMSDFVRNYNLGKVITDFSDLGFHLERIDNKDLSNFSNNCYKFFKTHLDLDVTIQPLLNIIFSLLDRKTIMETINKANNHMVVKKPIDSFETQGKVPDLMYEFGLDAPSSEIDVKNAPVPQHKKVVFPESALAHEWLDGLKGLEIGPSTHNPFGLDTKNVGIHDEIYEKEQLSLVGKVAKLDIIARADEIPLPDESEDFVLSSHVIEHCPNMIKTLVEWFRIIRSGGYLFMIVPHRNAAPSDVGRPLTEWEHLMADFRRGSTEHDEPEAGKFGHCHYHVFDCEMMQHHMARIFGDRLQLVAQQPVDDKIGNGFTLVYRKTVSNAQALPWEFWSQPPTVSAIVSTYNSEKFMRGCLEDLVNQTLYKKGQLEIVVIDSGSEENEAAIVKEFQQSYPHIVYQRTERETIYQAWNRGVKVARGKYVTNANTDDRHRPDALEVLALALDTNQQVTLVYADVFVTNAPNQAFESHIRCGYHLRPDYSQEIMLSGCHMGPQPMWRKDIHDKIGFFSEELRSAGDYELWCRMALTAPLLHLPEFLGLYYENPRGFCNADMALSMRETALVKQAYSGKFPAPQRSFTRNLQYGGPTTPGKFVNIGMVTYNRLEFTRQAIAALVSYTDFPYVLTVIDNSSSDGTQDYLTELKRAGIIRNLILLDENVGVAKASNLAWSLEPNADYYLKLDNDIVIQKMGWLTGLVRTIDAIPQLGAVAYNFEPASYPLHEVRGVRIRPKNGNLGGACVLIPRRTHEKLGYWCEDYGLYGEEDGDYGLRIQFAGLLNAYMEDEEIGLHLPAGRAAVIDPKTFVASDGREELEHTEYRQWKDAQRRKNIIGGTLSRNLERYRNDRTSLFIASPFAAGWLAPHSKYVTKHAETAADASTFKKVSDKIKVSVFSLDAKVDACGYYRIQAPLEKLVPEIEVSWEGIEFWDGQYHIAPGKVDTADIIVVQRFFPRPETAHFLEFLCSLDKPVIFEIDDLLTQIPASNPSYGLGVISTPHIYELVRKCAAVTVSTPELKSHFSSYSNNVYVLPNLLDSDLWETPSPPSFGPIVIGYAGGKTHATDISLLEEVLEAIAGKYPGKVVFTFMGCATERLSRLPGFVFIPFNATYEAYARKMQQTPMDIALVPLEDNPFNRCKSNIKWLEYSACGFAGIYADLRPYSDCIEHGQTGLLVGPEPDQWYRAIELLIEHPELRHSIASNARQKVLSTYTLKTGAHCWLEVYHEVLARHKAGIPVPTGSFR